MRTAVVALALIAGFTWAQSLVTFDVVSVKSSDPDIRAARMNIEDNGSLTIANQPLRAVIAYAYDLRSFQLTGGPGWVETDHYDISGKTEGGRALARERTRALLAERFGLTVHHEAREQTVYLLSIAKGGSRMKPSVEAGPERGIYHSGRGHAQGFAATTEMLARELAGMTERAVIDKTGLSGKYDWILEWAPDSDDATRPSLFTALQEELGLKLETAKGPVDMVVIDHVDRPSGN